MKKLLTFLFVLINIVMHSYGMQIWPIYMDSITFQANEQFVVADFRSKGDFVQGQVNDYFLIWNDTWNEGDIYSVGNMTGNNFYNNGDEFLSLITGNFGWVGAGFLLNIPASLTEMQALKDAIVAHPENYWLHLAIKSTTTGNHAFNLFNNTDGFTIGTNQVNQRTIIGDFPRDGEWHEFYVPMSNYANGIATMVLSTNQNNSVILSFMTDGMRGIELDLDAIYFCDNEMKGDEPILPKCGDAIVWDIVNDTLLLTGSGATFDYEYSEKKPWDDFSKNIHVISISEGITTIGANVFKGCYYLRSIILPNTVTTIKNGAFQGCGSIASITIPENVTSIGDNVFSGCGHLTTVTIGNGVTSIGNGAFENCSSLTSITIPNSVTSIGGRAFSGCSRLTSLTIPNSVTSIGDFGFGNCTSLTSVTIGNGVTSIGGGAFYECSSLTSITIPNSVTSIGGWAFYSCSSLTSAAIGNGVTSIGNGAFENCSSLTSITIPNGVTSIGNGAFENCSSLTSITIPNSVTSIGGRAFSGCSRLTSATIGNGVTSVEGGVFYSCSSLTSVTIGNSFTSIGGGFEGCTKISEIHYRGNITDWCKKSWRPKDISSSYDLYIGSDKVVDVIIPDSISELKNGCWEGCITLSTILIPKSVTKIGDETFKNCKNLVSVNIPINITSINTETFSGCSSLTSITIPQNVGYISREAFNDCNHINSVVWNAKQCYDAPFADAKYSISSFKFGEEVEFIPSSICNGMSNLSSVIIPNKVVYIGLYAFEGCSSLLEITIPNSVKYIGGKAFSNCSRLETLILGTDLEGIADSAFADCKRILDIYSYAKVVPEITSKTFKNVSVYAYLHVPADMMRRYEIDEYWNDFILMPMGAETTTTNGAVLVQPGENNALIAWPTFGNAASYSLVITKDGVVFCTLIFNAQGQLTGIAFAPGKDGNAHAPAAVMTEQGYQFTVTGLAPGTLYAYQINVSDSQNNTIASYEGTFSTNGYEAIDDVESQNNQQTKILRNGQILILRGDKVYTLTGQEIK